MLKRRHCARDRWNGATFWGARSHIGLTLLVVVWTAGLTAREAAASSPTASWHLDELEGFAHGKWRVSRIRIQKTAQVQLWLTDSNENATRVDMLCRDIGAPQLPAVAHTARFDLRVHMRGATPEPFAEAIVALAKRVQELNSSSTKAGNAGPNCNAIQPPEGAQLVSAPPEFGRFALHPLDVRLAVQLERAVGVSLRDLSFAWLLLWALALALWARPNFASIVARRVGVGGGHSATRGTMERVATWLHRALPYAPLAVIVGAGLWLRVVSVDVFTMNPDEHASLDADTWLNVFRGDDDSLYHPPLARAVFRGWTHVWKWVGTEGVAAPRWWWRLPSVVTGTALIPLVWQLTRRRGGALAAHAAAALVATLPHAVFISDLGKPYAMTTCAVFVWLALVDRLLTEVSAVGHDDTGSTSANLSYVKLATRRQRALIAACGLVGAVVAWLDYPAALALFIATFILAWRERRLLIPLLQSFTWTVLAAVPLLPLALSGVQYAEARQASGPLPPGFPNGPHLTASFGLGGGRFEEVLRMATVDAYALFGLLLFGAALLGLWRRGGIQRTTALLVVGWLAFAVVLARYVYTRPQNLGFLLISGQVVIAAGVFAWLPEPGLAHTPPRRRDSVVWPLILIAALVVARGPQLGVLYKNQVNGSIADMAYGPDCHRVAAALQPWRYLGVTTLVQIDGDPLCVLVELVPGDPHQRAFPLKGNRPQGAPCYEAVGLRLCAAEGDNDAFSRELDSLPSGLAVVRSWSGPARPSRCQVVGKTADFSIWWCLPPA